MAKWSIGKRLFTGVGALVALIVLSGTVSIWTGRTMKAQLDETTQRTARTLSLALSIADDAVTLSNEQRRLLLAGLGDDKAGVEQARHATEETRQTNLKRLEEITGLLDDKGDLANVQVIAGKLREWDATNGQVQQFMAAGSVSEAWDVGRAKSSPLLDEVRKTAKQLVAHQDQRFAASVADSDRTNNLMLLVTVAVLAASLLMAAIVIYSVRSIIALLRQMSKELAEGAQQVASASSQVAGTSQALSQGATQQAASLEETSASMEEMASITRQNAENSHRATEMANEAAHLTATANTALGEMVNSMGAIKESSDKVAKIIKTIDEIAFQTNILALNAAVEAARAGEAGMGFAVVADEVRSLAQRSAQAAKDTAALIEESIGRANEGQQRVGQVSNAVTAMSESSTRIKGLIEEVSVASRQQAQGIDQVTHAVSQMEKVTQTTAANAEESAAASEELSAQAETAMAVVNRLASLVDGNRRHMAHAAPDAPAPGHAPAKGSRKVVQMQKLARPASIDPEAEIPLGDGTYGKF